MVLALRLNRQSWVSPDLSYSNQMNPSTSGRVRSQRNRSLVQSAW